MYNTQNVSRGTMELVEEYFNILEKWNKHINLISSTDLKLNKLKHLGDGLAVSKLMPDDCEVFDLGSGNGIPGIMISIIKSCPVTLIESDHRKGVFLEQTARRLGIKVKVIIDRFENVIIPQNCQITARGLMSVKDIIANLSANYQGQTIWLLKGKNHQQEINEALKDWKFNYKLHPQGEGAIVEISNITV